MGQARESLVLAMAITSLAIFVPLEALMQTVPLGIIGELATQSYYTYDATGVEDLCELSTDDPWRLS